MAERHMRSRWAAIALVGLMAGCAGPSAPAPMRVAAPDLSATAEYTIQQLDGAVLTRRRCMRLCRRLHYRPLRPCVRACERVFREPTRPGLIGDGNENAPEETGNGDTGSTTLPGNGTGTTAPPDGGGTGTTPPPAGGEEASSDGLPEFR